MISAMATMTLSKRMMILTTASDVENGNEEEEEDESDDADFFSADEDEDPPMVAPRRQPHLHPQDLRRDEDALSAQTYNLVSSFTDRMYWRTEATDVYSTKRVYRFTILSCVCEKLHNLMLSIITESISGKDTRRLDSSPLLSF